jgi:hypothetical protein
MIFGQVFSVTNNKNIISEVYWPKLPQNLPKPQRNRENRPRGSLVGKLPVTFFTIIFNKSSNSN